MIFKIFFVLKKRNTLIFIQKETQFTMSSTRDVATVPTYEFIKTILFTHSDEEDFALHYGSPAPLMAGLVNSTFSYILYIYIYICSYILSNPIFFLLFVSKGEEIQKTH